MWSFGFPRTGSVCTIGILVISNALISVVHDLPRWSPLLSRCIAALPIIHVPTIHTLLASHSFTYLLDENFNLEDGKWEDVHVITGALKLFFRELPEPLFPYSHFSDFVDAISKKILVLSFKYSPRTHSNDKCAY